MIIHGDSHVWNCLLPRDCWSNDVRLFDWGSWNIDAASDDLAYMMAMPWYPDRRQRLERSLLDRYHAALVTHGVRSYDRTALDEDYRLSALWLLMRPGGKRRATSLRLFGGITSSVSYWRSTISDAAISLPNGGTGDGVFNTCFVSLTILDNEAVI